MAVSGRRAGAWRSPEDRWWTPVLGLLVVGALAALDIHWKQDRIITATVVIGPFITALLGSQRQTAVVALAAVAVAVLSGSWNHNYGTEDYLLRVAVVIAGAAFAIAGARQRERLATDRRRFRLLSAAASISDVSSSVEETLQRLSELLVPALADIAVIDVVHDDRVERLAVATEGPRAAEIEAGMRRRAADGVRPASDTVTGMHSGRPQLIDRATDEMARRVAHDDEDLAFLRSLGARSSITVPLRARGRSIGALALIVTDGSRRSYGPDDFEFAKVLAGRVALALDNAGLFTELETLEAQQTAALGNLVEAVTVQDSHGRLVYANEAAAHALGFATAAELLATPSQQIVDAFESFNEDGSPVRLEQLPGRRVLAGEDEPPPLLVRAINRRTGAERWRVTKASAVLDAEGRPRLAVNVIEDVTEVKRAEVVQRFLADAGAVLASSLDYEETLAQVARLAVPQLADWCGVNIPDEHGYMESVAVAHVDPEKVAFARRYNERYPVRVDDEGGSAQVMRDGVSQVVNDIPDAMLEAAIDDPEQLAALRDIGMRAFMIVPMVTASGDTIGTVSFVTAESRRTFTDADLRLAEELGRRAGTAVENAWLYTERSRIARTLQASLLPDILPDIPGFTIASLYRPAGEENLVGGDFYDAVHTPEGWMLVVGDVTGRGAEAAALTAQARHTLRTAASLLGDPALAMDQLNRSLAEKTELSIVTVALALLREADGRTSATILRGGHPPTLLVRGQEVIPVGGAGPVVGAWPESMWPAETVELQPGDVLVLYTDGVTDAVGSNDRFGEERLAATLRGITDADGAVDAIRRALSDFERGPQADDTAVVAVQWLPAKLSDDLDGAPAAGDRALG